MKEIGLTTIVMTLSAIGVSVLLYLGYLNLLTPNQQNTVGLIGRFLMFDFTLRDPAPVFNIGPVGLVIGLTAVAIVVILKCFLRKSDKT